MSSAAAAPSTAAPVRIDRPGHPRVISDTIRADIRSYDIAERFGEEEFVVSIVDIGACVAGPVVQAAAVAGAVAGGPCCACFVVVKACALYLGDVPLCPGAHHGERIQQ